MLAKRASSSSQFVESASSCKRDIILRWPTVGRVAFTVVRLVTHGCTRGLSTRYLTVY